MPLLGRSRLNARTIPLLAVLGCSAFLLIAWLAHPWVFGDTPFVLDGSDAFRACLSQHDYHACGFTGKLNYWGLMSPMGDWPLLQHIPDLISLELGAKSHATRTRVLEVLNVMGIAGALVLAYVVFRRIRQPHWFWAFAIVVLSSPLLWWTRTTAGEPLAAGLLVALVAATVLPAAPTLVGLAAFAAALTKETSYPFVLAFGVLGLVLAQRRTGKPIRQHVVWLVVGLALAIVAASFFNIVRYGSILNTNTLDPHVHTLGFMRKAEYAAALIVAPNGGILLFWPTATVLLFAALLVPLKNRSDVRPSLVLTACLIVLTIGLASWWTPFGWAGFGPRLMLPWLPALVLLGLVAYGERLTPLVRRLLAPRWRLVVILAVTIAFTLPSVGQMWRPDSIGGFFAHKSTECQFPWLAGAAQWHACQSRLMWRRRPMQLYAVSGVATPSGLATSLVVALGLAGCLVLLRAPPVTEQRTHAEEDERGRDRQLEARVGEEA